MHLNQAIISKYITGPVGLPEMLIPLYKEMPLLAHGQENEFKYPSRYESSVVAVYKPHQNFGEHQQYEYVGVRII